MNPWERDQNLTGIREGLPPMWYAIYMGSLQAGFADEQAMLLTQTVAAAMMTTKPLSILPPAPQNPGRGEDQG